MKTVIIPFAFLFLLAQNSFANDNNENKLEKLRAELSKNIHVPSSLKKEGFKEKVTAVFTIKDELVTILEIRTDNQELKKHLEDHFKKVHLPAKEKLDGTYNVDFDFKVYN